MRMEQRSIIARSAGAEWAAAWQLPMVGMLGVAAGSMLNFSAGVLMADVTHTLGWSRAQFSLGITVGMLLAVFFAPVIGWVVHRFGVRPVALTGVILFTAGFSSLGLANGQTWQWLLLCFLQGLATASVSPTIWLTAVVGRFTISRGLAIATVLAGLGIAATLWPIAAAFYHGLLGWRMTFGALALSWAVVVWPLAFIFLRAVPHARSAGSVAAVVDEPATADGPTIWQVLRSRSIIFLLLANCMYAAVALGINLHMVPILQGQGFSLVTAASIAGLAGLVTLVGRIVIGFILDHAPARIVGVGIFLLPATACLLLLFGPHGSLPLSICAVILFGLGAGGEMDLVTYLAARNVPPKLFAPVYATLLAGLSAVASFGPLVAGLLYDRTKSYDAYLAFVIPMVLVGALLIWFLPNQPRKES